MHQHSELVFSAVFRACRSRISLCQREHDQSLAVGGKESTRTDTLQVMNFTCV